MSRRTTSVLAVLAAEAEADKWDEHPALFRLHQRGREHHLVDVGLDGWVWDSNRGDVGTTITALAVLLAAGGFRPDPDDPWGELVGMAFAHQGVSVDVDEADVHEWHQVSSLNAQRRLHQHPSRVPVRLVCAVDRHGVTYQVVRPRDGATERVMALPGRADLMMGGAVVEALDMMVATLCGVSPPPRPSAYMREPTDHLN